MKDRYISEMPGREGPIFGKCAGGEPAEDQRTLDGISWAIIGGAARVARESEAIVADEKPQTFRICCSDASVPPSAVFDADR
jgi:hypothetical protein